MHYLVDAYNLLFRATKKRVSLEKRRNLLIEELNDAASQTHLRITLVFDGAEESPPHCSRGHFDAIELVYTPKKTTADTYISEEVIHAKNPSQITVVTNDRELSLRCKSHRAKTLSIDEFIAFVLKKKSKNRRSSLSPRRGFSTSSSEFTRLLEIFEKKLFEELDQDSK